MDITNFMGWFLNQFATFFTFIYNTLDNIVEAIHLRKRKMIDSAAKRRELKALCCIIISGKT